MTAFYLNNLEKILLNNERRISVFEYHTLAEELLGQFREGSLFAEDYHAKLKKLAERRELPEKPEVRIRNVTFHVLSNDGEVACGHALNHPRLGETDVRTSLLLVKGETYFETLNTRYLIVQDEPEEVSDGIEDTVDDDDESLPRSKRL